MYAHCAADICTYISRLDVYHMYYNIYYLYLFTVYVNVC